ncbi:hypothetical protein [Bradyrhizobium sp. CW11]|uniref:hypothetical protein n=1 Tax=Bradyrhizobium sp. CW11 TaxID=2782684 RepID=UPI001FFAB5A1|nr:hypothetical protein [Bradyrhizobium sp. CW11]
MAKIIAAKELLLEFGSTGLATTTPATAASPSPPPHVLPWAQQTFTVAAPGGFNGTFAGLVAVYRSHPESPYHHLKHKVRQDYDGALRRIVEDVGSEKVADWSAQRVKAVYDGIWAAGGKVAMGRSMVTKLRLLCSFGSTVLNDDGCTRLSAILSNMRIPVAKSTAEKMTREQARAIRVTARTQFGWDSIALAQALQFEIPKLRQADVIGEWVPLSEPGTSDIVRANEKWIRGLRWSDIDENMVLRCTIAGGRSSSEKKEVEYRLSRSQMTMEEINRVPMEKRKGPLVICEFTGEPWSSNEFRRKWRIVADKAGVPANVRNGEGSKSDSANAPAKDIFG